MSQRTRRRRPAASPHRGPAAVFAALGDVTRLTLLTELSLGPARSITDLAADARITRQAISKHLHVLEAAGLVRADRQGREVRFRFEPQPVQQASRYLTEVAQQWDQALARLKDWVESDPAT